MRRIPLDALFDSPDSLRLVALGRIPRCTNCPRYEALVTEYEQRQAGHRTTGELPAVPGYCRFEVCAPLAARYAKPLDPARARPSSSGADADAGADRTILAS